MDSITEELCVDEAAAYPDISVLTNGKFVKTYPSLHSSVVLVTAKSCLDL